MTFFLRLSSQILDGKPSNDCHLSDHAGKLQFLETGA